MTAERAAGHHEITIALQYFSLQDQGGGANRVTRKSTIAAVLAHAEAAVVEYPLTGVRSGEAIAHLFTVNLEGYTHPQDNFQYSLGDIHGSRHNVRCLLLRDSDGDSLVLCHQRKISCMCQDSLRHDNLSQSHPKVVP
jgi:hypothetical protein